MDDYKNFDGIGLARLVREKEVSPRELLDSAMARYEEKNPILNAVICEFYDLACRQIESGLPDGPFRGVPFLLKDTSAFLKGTPTTYGSRLFRDYVPDHNSTLVDRYLDAGLVIFGKTNAPEMGLAGSTENAFYGDTRNPWDITRTAGGSSGGAAAAVAAGLVPAAHATDGGGSIRIPAAACGLVGLKPSRARTPMGPDYGEGWGGMAVQHVVSRTVRDSAALLDATAGSAPGDPYVAPVPARPYLEELGAGPGTFRVAFFTRPPNGVALDPECDRAVRQTAALLESLGHEVEEVAPFYDTEEIGAAWWALVATTVDIALTNRARGLGRELCPEDVEAVTWSAVEHARTLSPDAYARAVMIMHRHGRRMADVYEKYDLIMSPTLAQPAVKLGLMRMDTPDLEAFEKAEMSFCPFTFPQNMSGEPSISLPLHWTPENLPVGVMFSAAFGDEASLFRIAGQLEAAKPWHAKYNTL
ncbi:amidase [Luteithermobacter gelatinilyticus]|uniref:amidase n=1 Tax=Luteithermobacter gelatinilyticus TaxID=2582913 RepID=UPI001105EB2F|nr:amidase [Luteithermobacter gelatinilyticus]